MGTIKEILAKRNLLRELVLKNLKIRYSLPALGFFWAFLSPLLIVGILYLVFSVILKVKTEEAPFVLYLMSAIFPWYFFQNSLVCSATSLVDNRNLIKESGFPHYLVPLSIILANMIVFLPSLVILIAVSAFILKGLPVSIVYLPVVLVIHLTITFGLSIMLSIAYVRWRDIKYMLEAVLLLLFYLTPVFYSIYLVKTAFSYPLFKAYLYNPFTGVLNLYRATLLKGFYPVIQKDAGLLLIVVVPAVFAVLFLLLGFYVYKINKNSINDYLSY